MGRKHLEGKDRIKNEVKNIYLLMKKDDWEGIKKYINTIRSKNMRMLCLLCMLKLDNNLILISNKKKDIGKIMNISERTIYDYVKVIHFIEACGDVGFEKFMAKFDKLSVDDKQKEEQDGRSNN